MNYRLISPQNGPVVTGENLCMFSDHHDYLINIQFSIVDNYKI